MGGERKGWVGGVGYINVKGLSSLFFSFVSSALQQSKVKLTWDETDPHRIKLTQKK